MSFRSKLKMPKYVLMQFVKENVIQTGIYSREVIRWTKGNEEGVVEEKGKKYNGQVIMLNGM